MFRPTALAAARVFDSLRAAYLENSAVVIRGDRVDWTGPRAQVPDDAIVIDLGDATILPGLVDVHVHLAWDAWEADRGQGAGRDEVVERALANAARQLDHGVTTVRDLGAPAGGVIEAAELLDTAPLRGAAVVAAGRAIGAPDGHAGAISRPVRGAEAMRTAVAEEVAAGARAIKLMATGGVLGADEDPSEVQLDPDELQAATNAAHAAGLAVAVHAHARPAIVAAVRGGADSIEHGSQLDGRTASLMAAAGTWLVPTLAPLQLAVDDGERLGLPEHVRVKAPRALDGAVRALAHAREAGVRIAAGTDAGVPGQEHGSLVWELQAFSRIGMPPADCLAAATIEGARLLRLADRGHLAAGMRADLVVVDGDPLRDIGVLNAPLAVMRSGRLARGRLAPAA